MATEFKEIESRLWKVADTLRANSGIKASDYSTGRLISNANMHALGFSLTYPTWRAGFRTL